MEGFLPVTIKCNEESFFKSKKINFDLGFVRNDYGWQGDYSGMKHNNTCFFNSLIGSLKRKGKYTNFPTLLLIGSGYVFDEDGNSHKMKDGWDIKNILGKFIDTHIPEHKKGIQNIVDFFNIILCMWRADSNSCFINDNGGECFKGSDIDPCEENIIFINLVNNYTHYQELLFISQITVNNFFAARLMYIQIYKTVNRGVEPKSIKDILNARKTMFDNFFRDSNMKFYLETGTGDDLLLLPWEKFIRNTPSSNFNKNIYPDQNDFLEAYLLFLFVPKDKEDEIRIINASADIAKRYAKMI